MKVLALKIMLKKDLEVGDTCYACVFCFCTRTNACVGKYF